MRQNTPLTANQYYHIFNRGNNREKIFLEEANYMHFLRLWKKYISPIADTYAYSLLGNHFHAMIRVKESTLVELNIGENHKGLPAPEQQFSNLFNAYAKSFNNKYDRIGKLFSEQFKRKLISNDIYFTQLIYYIHSNPQRHGLINDFRKYKYSSYNSLLSTSPSTLMRDEVLEWFGGKDHFLHYHNDLHKLLTNLQDFKLE